MNIPELPRINSGEKWVLKHKPDENKILDFVIENDLPVPPYMTQGTTMFFNNKLKGGK